MTTMGLRALRSRTLLTRHHGFCPWKRPFSIQSVSSVTGDTRIERQADPTHLKTAKRLAIHELLTPTHNADWQLIQDDDFQYLDIPSQWNNQLTELQTRLGVHFHDVRHLKTALVHHGAVPHTQVPTHVPAQRLSNRSLEFLGDAVLGMAVSSFVFQTQPRFQEGQLTRLKSVLVNNETLSKVAVHDLGLHELILVASEFSLATPRDDASYLKGRTTIQAGAVEALIAAVYVDQGLERALSFVNEVILPSAMRFATEESTFQPVVALQNLLQAHSYGHPIYKRVPAPSTSAVFQVELFVRDEYVLTGEGASYKEARVNAARSGFEHFTQSLSSDNVD